MPVIMTYIGNPWPKFTYGLAIGGGWKNLEVKAMFNGALGNDIYNAFDSWEYNFFSDYNTTASIYETSFFGDNGVTSDPRSGTLTDQTEIKTGEPYQTSMFRQAHICVLKICRSVMFCRISVRQDSYSSRRFSSVQTISLS